MKRMEDVGCMKADEVEGNGGTAAVLRQVKGDGREAKEGDRWEGLGDGIDVRDDGWGVPKASGKEDGDGVSVVVVVKDEFAKLHH